MLFPAVMRWHGLSRNANRLGFAQCVPFEEFVVADAPGTDDSASSIVAASASLLRAGRIGRCVSKGSVQLL